jgi:hypothetical protein
VATLAITVQQITAALKTEETEDSPSLWRLCAGLSCASKGLYEQHTSDLPTHLLSFPPRD